MRKKNKSFLILTLFISFVFLGLSFIIVQAQSGNPLSGLDDTAGQVTAFQGQTGSNADYSNFLQTKAGQIIGAILSFVGVLFLGLMIYAGILWMTAQDNEQQVNKAKGMLTNAIIGIIIVFAAYAITAFIGAEILQ